MKNIFVTLSGSHLYGTNDEHSDYDVRGICFEPESALLGLHPFEQLESQYMSTAYGEIKDSVIYGLRKFVTLASAGNPNIIELLYAPTTGPTLLDVTHEWYEILDHRDWFLSKRIAQTFMGYAISQLEKMQTHFRWMNADAPTEPDWADFGAKQKTTGGLSWPNNERQNAYQVSKREYENYCRWIKERNPKRSEMEKKYGYDTKNATHLARLLLGGIELMTTGNLTIPSRDLDILLNVKHGQFLYREMLEWADDVMNEYRHVEDQCTLPQHANMKALNVMCIDLNRNYLEEGDYEPN